MGEAFKANRKHPELGPKVKEAQLTVAFCRTDPDVKITVDSKNPELGYFFNAYYGDEGPEPEVTFSGKADDGHKFWLGNLNLMAALARRQIVAKGTINKALKLLPALSNQSTRRTRNFSCSRAGRISFHKTQRPVHEGRKSLWLCTMLT